MHVERKVVHTRRNRTFTARERMAARSGQLPQLARVQRVNDFQCGSSSGGSSCCGNPLPNDATTNTPGSIHTIVGSSKVMEKLPCDAGTAGVKADNEKQTKAVALSTRPILVPSPPDSLNPHPNESANSGKPVAGDKSLTASR